MDKIEYNPIGIINSPFTDLEGMPIQPRGSNGINGKIELKKEYKEGLTDLEGFSHIILIYHLHKCNGHSMKVRPFLDDTERGIFSTRSPKRPNSIGISVVRLEKIEKSTIYISSLDILDKTPLLDIKPYIPQFDKKEGETLRLGWLEEKYMEVEMTKSDKRFMD